ncbi:helix-turn-helix domain-containing protein [Hungatella effluvii]|uniref:helix-turn-helix domain-containing protein n=1 Tax=Hungatella effluvii TaxID=1096246 RepID=UPI0022E5410F|nr:helix-turn-helix transcriptional regulator [Hungatella effluvii]
MKYNRVEAAKRIRTRRKELGLSSAEVADKIRRANHYYGDIERGTCGMSIDTLIELTEILDISSDYILFGKKTGNEISNVSRACRILKQWDERKQERAVDLMKYYLELDI